MPEKLLPEGFSAAHDGMTPEEEKQYKELFDFSGAECGRLSTKNMPEDAEAYTTYPKFQIHTYPARLNGIASRVWRHMTRVSFILLNIQRFKLYNFCISTLPICEWCII